MFWILIISIPILFILFKLTDNIGHISEFIEAMLAVASIITMLSLLISFGLCFICIFTVHNGRVAERMYPVVEKQVAELEDQYGVLIDKYIEHEAAIYDSIGKDKSIMISVPEQKVSETLDQTIQDYTELKNSLVNLEMEIVKGELVRYYLFLF